LCKTKAVYSWDSLEIKLVSSWRHKCWQIYYYRCS